MEYIKILSKDPWVLKEIEYYHPDTDRHTYYWRELKKKAIEGVWGEDFNNEFRFMPPKLWYYVNFGLIQDEDKKTKARKEIRPLLADVMWEISYACIEARGFSGFKNDELRTADRNITKISKSRTPTADLDMSLYLKPGGNFKDFVDPRDYIRSRHDKPYGCPLYNNGAQNLMILGARGGGKSFYLGNELHTEILFDGTKEYTEESIQHPTKVEVFLGSAIASKSTETAQKIKAAHNALTLKKEFGVWGNVEDKDYEPSPFYKDMTGDIGPNNMKSPWRHEYEEKVNGRWLVSGTKSVLKHGVYTTEVPQVAAGGRYTIMFDEEVGLHDNVIVSHWSNEACMRRGTRKFGSAYYAGTAGSMEKILEAQEIFENPREYNMLAYKNDWEGYSNNEIGFFLPSYYTDFEFKDKEGNTDIEAARKHYEELHEKMKKAKNSAAYEGELMNTPIYPSQMFIKKQGNIFPIAELKDHLRTLEFSESYKFIETPGILKFDPKTIAGVSFDPDIRGELKPLTKFPLSQNETNREGCVVIYEFPYLDESGKVPPGAYIIGHDPVAKADEDGASLSTIYVMKTKRYFSTLGHDEIVATFIGRPYNGADQVNETLEKLAMFYGGSARMIYFENMVGEVKPYFEKKKKLILLATQPQTVLTNTHKTRMSKLVYGYPMSNQYIKQEACRYVRKWLLEEWGKDDKGNTLLNLHKIQDRGLIQELISFNMEDNFDRVMGFSGCVIGLEETHNQFLETIEESRKPNSVINFFKRGADLLKGNDNNYYPTKTEIRDNTKKQTVEEGKHRFPMLSSK